MYTKWEAFFADGKGSFPVSIFAMFSYYLSESKKSHTAYI